jgi:ABC-2 type transport system permease protein
MSALASLTRIETKLLTREWAAMVFAFVFPPVTLLIIGGAFGDQPDDGFGNVIPEDFYVTGYLGVPMAALALIGLPVVLASYRERDVLRRFAAFGVSMTRVVTAQALVTALLVVVAAVTVLAAGLAYGIPSVEHPLQVGVAFVFGAVTMIVLGVAIGLSTRTARGAQAIGLMAFFPMFLLSGGGPPPDVMSEPMRWIADVLPLTHVVAGIRDAWLGTGGIGSHLLVLSAWLAAGLALVAWRLRQEP